MATWQNDIDTTNTADSIKESLDSALNAVKHHTNSEIADGIAAVLNRIEWIDKTLKRDALRSDTLARQYERMHLVARLSVYVAYLATQTGNKPSDWV